MDSDPQAAKQKLLEAGEVYRQAGNIRKASEMSADAMTAELLIQQQQAEQQN